MLKPLHFTYAQCSMRHSCWVLVMIKALLSSSMQLRQTQFYHLVCPMFVNYTRFNLTLRHISENDTNHVKLSLITFLLKKSMELTCENVGQLVSIIPQQLFWIELWFVLQVKRNCGNFSNLQCTTSSIANLCLQAPPRVLAQGFGPPQENILLETARQPQLIQSWIRENMAGRDPDDKLLVNLKTMLSQVALLNCTDSRPENIVCYHHLFF